MNIRELAAKTREAKEAWVPHYIEHTTQWLVFESLLDSLIAQCEALGYPVSSAELDPKDKEWILNVVRCAVQTNSSDPNAVPLFDSFYRMLQEGISWRTGLKK